MPDEPSLNVPQAFLSLSGEDDAFVEKVYRHLPDGLAFFYRKSFKNGEEILGAMERGVDRSSLFVFFASQASIASHWTNFELDQARLAAIRRPNFKILLFPLTPTIIPSMLPAWVRQYWMTNAGYSPKDIARQIRHALTSPPLALPALSLPVMGRGPLVDLAKQQLMASIAAANSAPNVFIGAGLAGIGRRTFLRNFLQQAMAASPDLTVGPELRLPRFADLADLYRALREQIEVSFTFESFERDLRQFRSLTPEQQVAEVVRSIQYFAQLGQAVFISTSSGLFEDRGDIKDWLRLLFLELAKQPNAKLCLITNRQLREEQLSQWPNVLQWYVPPLKDADIRALMTATSTLFRMPPVSPSNELIREIGGHPDIAKAVVRLIAQRGNYILERDQGSLFGIQDEVLSENLDVQALTEIQKKALCILSWVPQLDGRLLEAAVLAQGESKGSFITAIENLILGCLIQVSENSFSISSAIREMFRRKYGMGPNPLLGQFSDVLRAEWRRSVEANEFRTELFDAFVYMHALEGKELPIELRKLLLPSTLEEVVRETYARGRQEDDKDAYQRVINWGAIAADMDIDETVREEILSTVIRAQVRLERYQDAEELLLLFDDNGYRSTSFLRGFSLRCQEKYNEAVPHLRRAMSIRKNDRSTVQELATCYQKLGMRAELAKLVEQHERVVERSVSLMNFKIGLLLSNGKIWEAEDSIRRLQAMQGEDGRATIRRAQILIQRDSNFEGAERLLTGLIETKVGNPVTVLRWRAIAAANAGHAALARQDIEFIRARPGRQPLAQRLDVYFALAQNDVDGAERATAKLGHSASDELLRARTLEARANAIQTSLSQKQQLMAEVAELRAKNKSTTIFDED